MNLTATQFRVLNYCNIDDSGWIPLECVTVFVGRNESGKTALLKALHKFNPAVEEPYNARLEFPRDRFVHEFHKAKDWPVCKVEFELSDKFRTDLREKLDTAETPKIATLTRYYDGHLEFEYDLDLPEYSVNSDELIEILDSFAKDATRLSIPAEDENNSVQELRVSLANWANSEKDRCQGLQNLRTQAGIKLLQRINRTSNSHASPESADLIENLQSKIATLLKRAKAPLISAQLNEAVKHEMPIFIYFDNYGILDSSVYLPSFLENLNVEIENSRIRTINAMFKHVQLTAQEIDSLGLEEAGKASAAGRDVTPEMIKRDQENKLLRNVKLDAASRDISEKFSKWYRQRQHKIKYQADGSYFRIWVSDDRRQAVDIELERRSKGFQWFFSFYLVFLVESDEGHKDSVLLLDEPGLHLHPTAQQELIAFFEKLAKSNQLIYTTHSPFLIDGKHIHRVRPITEDKTGHSRISIDSWPSDAETIFPLWAAAGYAMVHSLFQWKKNVLVEGFSDYLYLHALNMHCRELERQGLPEDIYITPCGGTKNVGIIASIFLGQKVRPVILLDGDNAGRARQAELVKELYNGHEENIIILNELLEIRDCEIEDVIGELTVLEGLRLVSGQSVTLSESDRDKGSLVSQIKRAAARQKIELPDGWKPQVARRVVIDWSTTDSPNISEDILDRAEALFKEIMKRFEAMSV